jgi:hypothetical protein
MPLTSLQNALTEIVKQLEESISYVAALEAALIENQTVLPGQAATHLAEQSRKLNNARYLISLLTA